MSKLMCLFVTLGMAVAAPAVLVVDYTGTTGNVDARTADSDTTIGNVWNFSDSNALLSRSGGSSQTLYGGLNASWTVANDYDPYLRFNQANVQTQVNPANGSDTALTGMYVWNKADFLNDGDSEQMGFTSGDSISVHLVNAVGTTRDLRFVIKQDDIYYVSNQRYTGQTTTGVDYSIDPSTGVSWATIATDGSYAMGTFSTMAITNLQAVGLYVDYARTGNQAYVTFDDFQVNATAVPEPATAGLLFFSCGLAVMLRRIFL